LREVFFWSKIPQEQGAFARRAICSRFLKLLALHTCRCGKKGFQGWVWAGNVLNSIFVKTRV